MEITGSCHCGVAAYKVTIDPDRVGICHSTDCQILSGSAFRTVAFTLPGQFTLLTGKLEKYVILGGSGNERTQSFCPARGSPIYSAPVSGENYQYSMRVGTINERDKLIPKFQIWLRSAKNWLGSIPRIEIKEKR